MGFVTFLVIFNFLSCHSIIIFKNIWFKFFFGLLFVLFLFLLSKTFSFINHLSILRWNNFNEFVLFIFLSLFLGFKVFFLFLNIFQFFFCLDLQKTFIQNFSARFSINDDFTLGFNLSRWLKLHSNGGGFVHAHQTPNKYNFWWFHFNQKLNSEFIIIINF